MFVVHRYVIRLIQYGPERRCCQDPLFYFGTAKVRSPLHGEEGGAQSAVELGPVGYDELHAQFLLDSLHDTTILGHAAGHHIVALAPQAAAQSGGTGSY